MQWFSYPNHASLMRILSLISLWLWNFSIDELMQIILFKDQGDYVLPCSNVINSSKLVLKLSMVNHIFKWEMEIEKIRSYRFEVLDLVPKLADLGFVRETLIFQTWNFKLLIGQKDAPLQGKLSNVLLFWKQWWEAPGTGSPSFSISFAEISDIDSVVSLKFWILTFWNLFLR